MTARTVSARDLETMARAAHADIELPGPEGGWATATINGREYRARIGRVPEKVHACPPHGSGVMPCCGRAPFEVPGTDRMTLEPTRVTCKGATP